MGDELILEEFLSETHTNIVAFDSELLELEKQPNKLELLQSLYRRMHSIKGMASYFSFTNFQNLVHDTENIFSSLLEKNEIERTESIVTNKLIDSFFKVSDSLKQELVTIRENNLPKKKAKLSALQLKALESLQADKTNKTDLELDQNIVIDNKTLETLNALSSELILLKNQLEVKIAERILDRTDLESVSYKIDILTQKINKKILQIRMQPFSSISNKLKKMLRDIAQQHNKLVEFIIEGENIKIDRNIMELIKDPLIHILRNAIDHGIEDAETRIALGKNPIGQIKLKALSRKNHIWLHIIDDGKGLSTVDIKRKAIENELLPRAKLEQMTDREIQELIFLPGFSTKEEVTQISGRGVGMDVVKTNINKLNSTIEISTEDGKGTEFIIKLPLTLAIESALTVTIGGIDYLIPASYIQEVGRIAKDEIDSEKQITIRDKKIPLIYRSEWSSNAQDHEDIPYIDFVIIDLFNINYAFVVDRIKSLQNVVFKSLPEIQDSLNYFTGAAIEADGSVALILNMEKIYKKPKLLESYKIASKKAKQHSETIEETIPVTVLSFKIADERFIVDYHLVKEIATEKVITNIPGSKTSGVFNLRNNILLVRRYAQNDNIMIVLDLPQQGLISITVDEIGSIMTMNQAIEEEIKIFPLSSL